MVFFLNEKFNKTMDHPFCLTTFPADFHRFRSGKNVSTVHEELVESGLMDQTFEATEKIDGSNFCIMCINSNTIMCASRNRILNTGDKFHGFQQIVQKLSEQITQVFKECANIATHCEELEQVHIYGELFGNPVINRVNYGDQVRFVAFEVVLRYAYGKAEWPAHNVFSKVLEKCGIPCTKVLFTGTLAQCIAMDPVFPTTYGSGLAEGYMLRSTTPIKDGKHLYLKHKNQSFMHEFIHTEREDSADITQKCHDVFKSYLNDMRIISVLTQNPELSCKDFAKAFVRDVHDELTMTPLYKSLDKCQQKKVRKMMSKQAFAYAMKHNT